MIPSGIDSRGSCLPVNEKRTRYFQTLMVHFTFFFFPEFLCTVLLLPRLDVSVGPVHVVSMVTFLVTEIGRVGHIMLLKMERSWVDV